MIFTSSKDVDHNVNGAVLPGSSSPGTSKEPGAEVDGSTSHLTFDSSLNHRPDEEISENEELICNDTPVADLQDSGGTSLSNSGNVGGEEMSPSLLEDA